MLEARSLTKYYSAVPAVRDLSFRLAPGGILGLLGPNGSGKSTTVSILTGLLEPSGGTVHFDGRPIPDDLLAYKARIGYVPEEAVLYTYLTGPEYLSLVGGLRGIGGRRLQDKIDGFLTLFGLQDDVHAPMSAYSKGMRQKILISAALIHDPDIIVLDEPNSGLDVTTSLILRRLVQRLAAAGRMVVYSLARAGDCRAGRDRRADPARRPRRGARLCVAAARADEAVVARGGVQEPA